jgi:exosome complex exonuclease RRP6
MTTADVDDDDSIFLDSSLTELLTSLASGVRAVQGLALDDAFAFFQSLPSVAKELTHTNTELQATLTSILEQLVADADETNDNGDVNNNYYDGGWETAADLCEALVEAAELSLQHSQQPLLEQFHTTLAPKLQPWPVNNSRTEPFVPKATPDKPFQIEPLDLSLYPGHGLDDSQYQNHKDVMITPSFHVKHVYQHEIQALSLDPPSDSIPETRPDAVLYSTASSSLEAAWIDTAEQLQQLAEELSAVEHVLAMDLEAHSYRSFKGFTCLVQLSFYKDNVITNRLIDTLAVSPRLLNACLQPILANPHVVKALHGADHDVLWLQRDFGLYVVNLLDTGRAARALGLPRASYAYLLQHYCTTGTSTSTSSNFKPGDDNSNNHNNKEAAAPVHIDKTHQLADWRIRPLTESMQQYAIQDTYYLLQVLPCVLYDVVQADKWLDVARASQKVSLLRYSGEPFFRPDHYKRLLFKRQPTTQQERALKLLYDWRDQKARDLDESVAFVLDNARLVRLAMALPTSVQAVQGLFHIVPPVVMECAQEIIELIKIQGDEVGIGAPSSAFFKPAHVPDREHGRRQRGMATSPVMGTAQLYQEAGWTTPVDYEAIADVTTTDDDEVDGSDSKPKRFLSVHVCNSNYKSHPSKESNVEDRRADGMGTVYAAREHSQSPVRGTVLDESQRAKQSSAQIRSILAQKGSLLEIATTPGADEAEDDEDGTEGNSHLTKNDGEQSEEEEFPIPRSMREIYKISNRNRLNRKAGSPTPELGHTPTSDKERDELAKAESFLRSKGLLDNSPYFESGAASPEKKQRTKISGRESEESVPQDTDVAATREEDMALLSEIGWMPAEAPIENATKNSSFGSHYANGMPIGALDPSQPPNPFFSGAALTGGPLAQGFLKVDDRSKKVPGKVRPNKSKLQERPEKKDGKSFAYRKR